MNFILSSNLVQKYPKCMIAFSVAQKISVFGPDDGSNKSLLNIYPQVKEKYILESLNSYSNSQAYINFSKRIGISPDSAFLPHLQIKRVLKEKPIGNINNVVNEYMALELLYNLAFAAYDMDTISGDIIVDVAHGGEEIVTIGGEECIVPVNDLIISDNDGVFYSFSQGYRDSSKITGSTKNVLFQIDAPEGVDKSEVEKGINEISAKFNSANYFILDSSSTKFEFFPG